MDSSDAPSSVHALTADAAAGEAAATAGGEAAATAGWGAAAPLALILAVASAAARP